MTANTLPRAAEDLSANRTLAERAIDRIRSLILNGDVKPGDRLRLEELSQALQLSMTPIREALRRLEQLGLVQNVPHKGARVVPTSVEELTDLYEARLAVEPIAVAKAAANFTEEMYQQGLQHLQRLRSAEDAHDYPAMWRAHTDFHFLLYRASGSAWLLRAIEPMWERTQCYRTGYEGLMLGRDVEHYEILEDCRKRDGATAKRRMHNHLARIGNRTAHVLDETVQDPLTLVEI
ncbi:GntR family transcriptional regulator [Granulicella cerasi]|uniref:GntR family transcriptional regulator n=1 Tax=Granulicella cerasi TaxID=741063 RepID=UPI0021E00C4C|nr:GntR family transcriptional regulator [Granulicella cerasi]